MFMFFPFTPCGKACPPCPGVDCDVCPPVIVYVDSCGGNPPSPPIGPSPVVSKFAKWNVFNGMKVKIDEGKKIICFFYPGCEHCREAAKVLSELSKDPNFPMVYIYFGEEEVELIDEFFHVAGRKFPYQILPMVEYGTLLGTQGETPGCIFLWNGNIQKSYFGKDFNKDDLKKVCYQ